MKMQIMQFGSVVMNLPQLAVSIVQPNASMGRCSLGSFPVNGAALALEVLIEARCDTGFLDHLKIPVILKGTHVLWANKFRRDLEGDDPRNTGKHNPAVLSLRP